VRTLSAQTEGVFCVFFLSCRYITPVLESPQTEARGGQDDAVRSLEEQNRAVARRARPTSFSTLTRTQSARAVRRIARRTARADGDALVATHRRLLDASPREPSATAAAPQPAAALRSRRV